MATEVITSKKKSQKGGGTAQRKPKVGCNAEIEHKALSASYHRKYDTFIKSQPKGFQQLLERMLRAMFLRRPVNICIFFADFLGSELDRRTLAALQFGGLRFDGKKKEEKPEEPEPISEPEPEPISEPEPEPISEPEPEPEPISEPEPEPIPEPSADALSPQAQYDIPADALDDHKPSAETICMQPDDDLPDPSLLNLPEEDTLKHIESEYETTMGPISRTDHVPHDLDDPYYLDDEMSKASSLNVIPSKHDDVVEVSPSEHDSLSELCADDSKASAINPPEPPHTDSPQPSLHKCCSTQSTSQQPDLKPEQEDATTDSTSQIDPVPHSLDDPHYAQSEISQHGSTHSGLKQPGSTPWTIQAIGSTHSDLQHPSLKPSGSQKIGSAHDNPVQETSAISTGDEHQDQTHSSANAQQSPEEHENREHHQSNDIVAQQAEIIVQEAITASEQRLNQEISKEVAA